MGGCSRRSGSGRPPPIPATGGDGGGGDGGCAARDGGRCPEDGGPGGQAAGDTGDTSLASGGDPSRVARDGALPHAGRLSWVRRQISHTVPREAGRRTCGYESG